MAPIPDRDYYLRERYRGAAGRSLLLSAYYLLKPALPRTVQIALRRRYARRQARTQFPRWPLEPILVDRRRDELRSELHASGEDRIPIVNDWPDAHSFAAILTHDVEGPAGVANVRRVLEIERRHGFVSSWNFVAEWYPIDDGLFDEIRAAGGEIGLHGIRHDGRLFESRARFEAELPKIHHYLREWEAVGFRSPATHRNAEWMPEIGCLYDSSFPDTDPFEPQGGGCCSILPFLLGDLVELPITLVQDHTLWEILGDASIERWVKKSEWIIANHGLINLITHPDYLDRPDRLALYEQFLIFLAAQRDGWYPRPDQLARWWRIRDALSCEIGEDGSPRVLGDGSEAATVTWVSEVDGEIAFESAEAVHA